MVTGSWNLRCFFLKSTNSSLVILTLITRLLFWHHPIRSPTLLLFDFITRYSPKYNGIGPNLKIGLEQCLAVKSYIERVEGETPKTINELTPNYLFFIVGSFMCNRILTNTPALVRTSKESCTFNRKVRGNRSLLIQSTGKAIGN